jgi:NADP-dependent 3-hydroxy acid dehydrogenase YdfG
LGKVARNEEEFEAIYGGKPKLEPQEVAKCVMTILDAPKNVQIHDMIVRPMGQKS